MGLLQEVNTLTSIRLSETQKEALCSVIAAPTEEMAYEAVTAGTNMVAARDQLSDLGLLDWTEGSASVTDKGMGVLEDEALVDEMGELTEVGNGYAYGEGDPNASGAPAEPQPDLTPPDQMSQDNGMQRDQDPVSDASDPMDDGGPSLMDGYTLLQAINKQIVTS